MVAGTLHYLRNAVIDRINKRFVSMSVSILLENDAYPINSSTDHGKNVKL